MILTDIDGYNCVDGAMKHLERLIKMTNLALKLEWLEKDIFKHFKLNYKKHNTL
jgi:hypothetical protein